MEWILIVLFALAAYHFVYEGIIAPSLRMLWRFELFKMRDELHRLKFEHPSKLSDELFRVIESTLNNAIDLLPQVNVIMLYQTEQSFIKDDHLKRRIEKRLQLIAESKNEYVMAVHYTAARTLFKALLINHGGWIIYLAPIVLLAYIAVKSTSIAKKSFRKFVWLPIRAAVVVPEQDREQLSLPYKLAA